MRWGAASTHWVLRRRIRSAAVGLGLAAAVVGAPSAAHASESQAAAAGIDLPALPGWAEGRLVPGFQPPGFHLGGGVQRGLVLGIDVGPMLTSPQPQSDTVFDLTLGVHAGYSFGNGLALLGHVDILGTHPLLLPAAQENLLTFGVRYALPAFVIEPFAEGEVGLAWVGGDNVEPGLLSS
jgi:hypothetical protein